VDRLLPAADLLAGYSARVRHSAVYVAVFLAAAWANLATKDVTA
jgi:hypothetical protein